MFSCYLRLKIKYFTLVYFLKVVDVAKAIVNAIKDLDANGKTYALVG